MKKKKDILFLCQYFYPEYVSSATLPLDTAVALSNAGFTVGALCGYPKEYSMVGRVLLKETYENIGIRRLKYIQFKRSSFIGRLINYFSFTASVALHFFMFKNYKAIIVYSNPPVLPLVALLASKIFNAKLIFVSYDVYPEMAHVTNSLRKNSIISKFMDSVNRKVFKSVSKVVALSSEMKLFLLNHRRGINEHQIEVIPNWYEEKRSAARAGLPANTTIQSIKSDDNIVVSYLGNLGICQDHETILEAMRRLKNDRRVKFVFAGHGNKMAAIKSIVVEEGLSNVTVLGFLHGQDYQDALHISDLFIVSLLDGLTGLAVPSKTYSYMMAGKPVIAIMGDDSDIARDLQSNHAGFVVQVGEASKLVEAIIELRDDTDRRREMGLNCRAVFASKYTKEICTQKYVEMMKRVLGDKAYVQ